MMKRNFFLIFLPVFLAGVCLAETLPENKHYGGTLVWGHCTKPATLNPLLATSSISISLSDLIFNGLVRLNPRTDDLEPDLAQSWEASADGMHYVFHLRKGVRFHDGREFTSADVVFSYQKVVDPRVGSPYSHHYEVIKEVGASDHYTVEFKLHQPIIHSSDFFGLKILPKHLFQDKDFRSDSFNRHPVGTGPFTFSEWEQDDTIILLANKEYFGGRPYLDCIKTQRFSSNHDAWAALMRLEIDMVLFIGREDYKIVQGDPAFKAYAVPTDFYYALQYNMNDPVLSDKLVREAIAYAVDRKQLIERVEQGYGLECTGPFYPQALGFNPKVKAFGYDPQKAIQLLVQAGWKDRDKDGILEQNGKQCELKVLVLKDQESCQQITMQLRQQLQAIGIKLSVLPYTDESGLSDDFVRASKAQACVRRVYASYDSRSVMDNWLSGGSVRVGTLWPYKNMQVQRLFEAEENSAEKGRKQELLQELHQRIYDEQPCCFLYFPYMFHAVRRNFNGTDDFLSINSLTYTLKDWVNEEHK